MEWKWLLGILFWLWEFYINILQCHSFIKEYHEQWTYWYDHLYIISNISTVLIITWADIGHFLIIPNISTVLIITWADIGFIRLILGVILIAYGCWLTRHIKPSMSNYVMFVHPFLLKTNKICKEIVWLKVLMCMHIFLQQYIIVKLRVLFIQVKFCMLD